MSLKDSMDLGSVDLNNLDLNNVGSWPLVIKIIAALLLLAAVLGAGYHFHISQLQAELSSQEQSEVTLKDEFANKASQAASLDAYRQQMADMEESFGALLRQLPSDTEVPGLLEDITRTGLGSGLMFSEISLLPEVAQQFYVELPIQIRVTGGYHDLATFVSGAASLPRIVTLHDFDIKPTSGERGAPLEMSILAKTYRYNEKGLKK